MSVDNGNLGYTWVNVGTIGTVAVTDRLGVLGNVVIPGTYVGTVKFHDASSAAGTTATSVILTLGLPTTSIVTSVPLNYTFRKGLVYESTGTPSLTFGWN